MKNALKNTFNRLSMEFRLLHATHIKKDRQTYLTYLESAYGLHRADIVEYSRNDLRKIFKRCNSKVAMSAYKFGISGVWAAGGIASALSLVAATSPWTPVVYGVLAVAWAGLALMETRNIHTDAGNCLFFHKSEVRFKIKMDEFEKTIKERKASEKQSPEDTNTDENADTAHGTSLDTNAGTSNGTAALSLRTIARPAAAPCIVII